MILSLEFVKVYFVLDSLPSIRVLACPFRDVMDSERFRVW